MADATPLIGKLLIAMPDMGDPRFSHSVVFVCAHSEEGAMGLIVNKPTDDVTLKDLLEQLSIPVTAGLRDIKVHFGGPVETGRGFVLHGPDYASSISTLVVDARFAMTATLDILEELGEGGGPENAIMALGYAGWGPGQLEAELAANGWLACDATPELVFSPDDSGKWQAALRTLGIDALMLSGTGGRA
ncbi:YqgE/AlgH family protein [Rhodosalinus sp. K401]|uniref:YqgE/AlgH family protein n=1 Tax=Rhodosalinus sp. K401 TaxID=3239195 RepID=UPI0035267332